MKHPIKPIWIALGTLFTSLTAAAAGTPSEVWQYFGTEDPVTLSQELTLVDLRGGKITIPVDEAYTLTSITPLSGLSVVDFIFTPKRCETPDAESEMELILPVEDSAESNAEVGVILQKDCQLEVLVEAKDLGRISFFRR